MGNPKGRGEETNSVYRKLGNEFNACKADTLEAIVADTATSAAAIIAASLVCTIGIAFHADSHGANKPVVAFAARTLATVISTDLVRAIGLTWLTTPIGTGGSSDAGTIVGAGPAILSWLAQVIATLILNRAQAAVDTERHAKLVPLSIAAEGILPADAFLASTACARRFARRWNATGVGDGS